MTTMYTTGESSPRTKSRWMHDALVGRLAFRRKGNAADANGIQRSERT